MIAIDIFIVTDELVVLRGKGGKNPKVRFWKKYSSISSNQVGEKQVRMGMNACGCIRLQIKIPTPLSSPIPNCVEQEINMHQDSKEPRNTYFKIALRWYPPEIPSVFKQDYLFRENPLCCLRFQDMTKDFFKYSVQNTINIENCAQRTQCKIKTAFKSCDLH